jgi:quercetin 2,3-dioxygenase
MQMQKKIKSIHQLHFKENFPGFNSIDTYETEYGFEPFLVFTEFHMDRPIFGPHPHAGVSVMTYMLPDSKGSFLNRDSHGDKSTIEPGGMHVTQAGSGVKHDEVPMVNGVDCHGLQIWINHADKDRLVPPKAYHAMRNEVPEYKKEGVTTRVLQGSYENIKAPFELVTKITLLDVHLQSNTAIELTAGEMAFMYVLSGSIQIGDATITKSSLINFENAGTEIKLTAANGGNFIFASGTPHHEPIVYGGPFVMTTNEQMTEIKKRLGRGEMGELLPL